MRQVNYTTCTTLKELAEQTVQGLSEVYDYEFPEYLRKMPSYLKDCESYRELGTNQGGSASIALLENLKYYEFIDKGFKNYRPQKPILDSYVEDKDIQIVMHEMSSLAVETDVSTDFLLVDSVHKYKHVKQEIAIYAPLTTKYIMFHDTHGIPEVYVAVKEFLDSTREWKEIEHYAHGAGYTVLERIK
jgi:hypothetical protein